MGKLELIATAAFGLESVVAREVLDLGYIEQKVENGRVTFWGDELAVCRTNIWLRTADRVLLKMGQFEARTFEELFQQTKALPWPDWLPEDANFPVEGKSVKSTLFSVSDCQAIVKKAIVEKMKERYKRQWFEETGPRYKVEVALLKDVVTITIDTSGAGLHKRGYRKLVGQAPLKETLASALVYLSRWHPERPLIDPFCGSGTIPIEAAMLGLNLASGLRRDFAAEKWPNIQEKYWKEARGEALDLIKKDISLDIAGFDIDDEALSLARYHAREAGVEKHIHFQRCPVAELKSKKKFGYIICNPPYGERLEEMKAVERLYKEMGQIFKKLDTWSYYVLTSHPRFETLFGRRADKNRKLFNGRIETHYYQFFGPKVPGFKRDI
ncbi:methyltransferase domain-containing protein [Thermanaerosceptrum fracticalcis]|uniref:Methyltransferase domain-containing protein n=1 Tax=Thermanaerosceptrum fracticalcis TaxID=1712410 RepID=A0A7G6E3P1_THEFR|nr:class I SAM-dependent RNA methyltransferase [Thermanaerosceptrum fracticalcis]QNB46695.1 methyltransferase domain-containing protein [Thermanaerosceptrum fracticalcis]